MKVNLINDSLDRNHSFSQINQQNLIKEPLKNVNHNSKSSELTKIQVHDRVDILDVNSYRKINYRMNNQLMLPISSDENLLKLALDKIHYKMKQGEVLTKEDFDSLSKVLLSQDFALNIRKEFVTLVHKYINTQKKLPRIFLDSLEKAKIATTDPLKKDINLILTRALLINQQLTKPASKVKGGLFEKRGNLIVTRENVAVKRTNNFRSNILDLNLDKKATVQKGKELTLSKKVNSQKLPELPDNGNNKAWYRSSLIEVQNYLCLARSNAKLTKEDFDYLYTCLYSNNKEHQIARADPGIFEILKHTTYYGQQLPKKFIPVIENVLTGKILNTSGNEWSNAIKETFNTYTLSLTNRYSLSNCENQSDIAWCIGKVAPSILCNLAGQAQILEPSTLDSMHYSLSNKKDEHGLILYTFGIASRNQDLKERFEKITPLIKIDNNVLPIVTSAAIEALTRYSVDISKNALNFLEKTLEKFDKNNAIFFFGKKDTRESSSWEKRYSWRDSHYEAVNKFFNISNKGEDLTLGELKYLKDHIKQDYVGNKDLMKNCTALIILKKVTYNGQKLPPETINVLEKLVTTKDIDTKKQITFILGCVLRNGQNVASSAISEMEKVFDLGRKSSAYALGYHVEKYGTDNLPSTAMNSLKSILGRTHQDKEMRSAISFALNTIIQKSIKASITDLEDELLKNPELTSAFLNAVLKKEILSPKAIINLGKICSSRNIEIEIRRNASLTLSCAAENDTQIFPEDILENFVEVCLKNKDIDICNNSASFLGYQASKNIEVLATKHNVIKYLDEAIPNTEISINASFALQCIAENMDKVHPSTLKNFNILFETSGKMLVDGKYNTDTKCNIALSLAHAAKNGCKFTKDTIAKITELLSESDNQDINKPLLSALGYSAQYPELFSEASLSKIIFTLNSDKKDVSDSARAVLEKILTNKSYKLPESCLINLAQIVGEDNASVNSLHLLKQVIEHTNSLPIEALTLLSKALLNVSDIESLINISVVLARSSTEQKFTDEILNNIESGLDYEEWEIIDNLTLAVKNSANNGIKLSQDLIAVLSDIVIDESTTLTTKQNSTIAISLTSDKSKLNSEQVLSALLQSFDIQDVEISKALMLIFGNYFGNCFDYRLQNTNSLIVKQLENHLNDEHFIENGMYAISKVVANKYLLSEDTISFTGEVLIKFQDQKVRNYAKQVLQTYNDYHKITLDYVLNILKIESISSDLLLNPDAKTLLKLKNFAARGNELTITSFEAISNLTKTQYEKYQDEILEILKHIAINEQELPDLLVSNLVKKLKTVSLGQTSNIEQLTEILYRSSNSRQSMPEGLIEALETKVVEGYIDEYSADILNLGAKRGKKIKDKVIDKLLDLLPQSSTQIKNSITQTIAYQIPYLDYVSNLFSENLIGILGKNKDINKEYISLALEQLGMRSNVGFSKNNIKLLDGIKNEHFQITNNTQTLSDEKDLFTLLNELKTTNNNLDILALIKDNRLQDRIVSIEKAYSAGTNFFNVLTKNAPLLIGVNKESEDPIICLKEPIKFWSEEDINIWSKCFIRSSNQIENKQKAQNEIIAVIKRAIEIDSSKNYGQLHELRTVQLLSILLMLDAKSGLLAQIATGEGKSTIVSAVAVINALQGRKVDVITSSSVLAKRDVKEKASFYNMFNLKASDNGDEGYGFKETKNCYKNDVHIIYGDAANFQFDILRHEYSALGTRGNRSFDNTVAIIDEVDSMFIDDNSKIAMLADTMPGMSNLNIFFTSIWQELERIPIRFQESSGDLMYYRQELENEEFLPIKVERSDYISFIYKELTNYVKKLVDNVTDDNTQDIKIPKHLTKFVKNQVDKWVISAIDAKYQYKLNHHYLIVKDNKGVSRVTPVDYANTGIVQNNTTWGDGLQQFLQIKEGLKITPETLITNFLSNKAYFERYNSRIYGLTGTLGSDSAKKFLKDIYKIDFVNIPRYKNRPFIEKETIIAESKEEWTKNIIETTLNEVTDKRAVLIICETKKNADKLFNELTTRYRVEGRKGRVIAYTRNDNNENRAVESRLHSGDIVVATNLAGRGTDIKTTKEVEDAGGLHLCVTFLADNLRVEQQAFGRTARQGQKGSAQLIINKDKLGNEYLGADNIKTIREIRNDLEENKLDSFQKNELPQINLKDQLFSRLCNLLTKLRSKVNKDDELEVILHEYKLESIEERWGLFLKHLDFSDINSIESKFEEFIKKIDQEYQSDDVIENPSYYIRYGNALIDHINDWKTKAKKHLATTARVVVSSVIPLVNVKNEYQEHKDLACRKALEAFDQAIKLDPEYSHAAYYKKAYILIEMKANGYKEKAKKNLQEAQKIVVDTIPRLMATQLSFNAHGTSNLDSEFSNQISNKVNILKALSESIHQSIRVIDKSEKLIDVSCHGKNFTALKKEAALEKVKSFYGNNDITVKLHDLKAHSDMGTKYQAKNTIDAALEEYPALRNIDITFNNLGKEQAINLLPSFRRDKTEDSIKDKDIQKEKMLPEEYEALSWMEKSKLNISKFGQGVKDTVVNVKDGAVNSYNKVYNSAKNWLDEYEAAKKVPVNLSLYNLSQNQAGDLLKSLPSINEVMVTINTENKNGIDKYLSVQDAQKFIGEFTQTLRDSIKKTLEQEDSVNSTQISIDEVIGKQIDGVGINLTFRKLSQKTAKDLIDNSEPNNIDLNFEDLGQKDAKRIIYANEDHIGDSVITFNNLDRDQARFIIEKADRTEQDVEVQDIKRLEDLFLISDMPKAEIIEARADGIDGIIHLYEQQPIKVASCLTVGALGVGQIILGSILIAVPDVGTALISEGIGDIITSVRGAVSRNFSWDDYFIQKSISIAISLATAGLGRLNSVKSTAQYSTKTKIALGTVDDRIMRNVSKQVMTTINKSAINTGEQIAMKETINISEKIIEKGISGIAQDSWKTAGKLVLTQLAESGAKEALNLGVDQLSEIGIKSFQPQVAEKVELSLKNAFDHLHITKSIAIDKYQENKENQSKIEDRAYKILNPRNNRLLSSLTSISTGILNKKSSKSSIGSFIEPLKQVAEMSSALSKVITITDNFDHDFTKYLDKLDLIKVEDLIFKGQKFDNTEKRAILKELEKHSIINVKEDFIDIESIKYPDNKEKFFESGLYNEISTSSKPKKFSYPNNIEDIRLNEQTKNNVKKLGNLLYATHASERNMLHKSVSNMITNQIIGTIQSGLVKPMTSLAISKAVQYASEKIQRHVNSGRTVMEEVDALQKSENLKGRYEGFMRALTEEEKAKYLPLYEQAIEDAKTGKGNMLHLLVLVKELEACGESIKISLFKDGKYYDTMGNNDSTNCIIIDNSDDHWTVMDEKTGEFRNADKTGSGNNDCLFDCLAKYTNGKSADELRNLTVAGLNENQDYLIHFMPAYQSASNNPDLFGGMWSGGDTPEVEDLIQTIHKITREILEYGPDNKDEEEEREICQEKEEERQSEAESRVNRIRELIDSMDDNDLQLQNNIIRNNKAGRCGENANLVFEALVANLPETVRVEKEVTSFYDIEKFQEARKEGKNAYEALQASFLDNHAYVVVRPRNNNSNSEAKVSDSWKTIKPMVYDYNQHQYSQLENGNIVNFNGRKALVLKEVNLKQNGNLPSQGNGQTFVGVFPPTEPKVKLPSNPTSPRGGAAAKGF